MTKSKNKSKKSSKIEAREPLNHPPEVHKLIIIACNKRRREKYPLHYSQNSIGITKSWMPASSRCVTNRARQLYVLNAPTNDEYSVSNCPYGINQTVAVVGCQIRRSDDLYYRGAWPKYECVVVDPFDSKKRYMELLSVVGRGDKRCALSLQGCLAFIESNEGSGLVISRIGSERAVPSLSCKFFKEYLVEMDGEIFIIFFIHAESLEIIDRVEVFRVCFVKFEWVKVENLEGKAIFLDRYNRDTWVKSEEIGCKGDCVYFTRHTDNIWWLYDMETCCISSA